MRIMAPADSAAEAALLIEAGAGALYFGYMPRGWQAKHSALESFNRRSFPEAQITDEEEVAALLAVAGSRGVRTAAAFNALYYPEWMYAPVVDAARKLAELGVDDFIVSDLSLIGRLREEGVTSLSLSTMAGVTNAGAARFYGRLGVNRVTLPRELTVGRIAAIATANPRMIFDVFVLFGACANMESFCRWVHDDPGRIWPCVKEWRPRLPAGAGGKLRNAAMAQAGWGGLSRIWACGLCALADLSEVPNVEGLKVVGRGAPGERKLAGVRLLASLLGELGKGLTGESFRRAARERKQAVSGADCHPYLCYYPEYL